MFKHASSHLKFYEDEEKQSLNIPSSPRKLQAFSRVYVGGSEMAKISDEESPPANATINTHLQSNANFQLEMSKANFGPDILSKRSLEHNQSNEENNLLITQKSSSRHGLRDGNDGAGLFKGSSAVSQGSRATFTQANQSNFAF
jgi:hypothetical protein